MDPFTIGAGAFGALESVTGGNAGPSGAWGGQYDNRMRFGGLTVNDGPDWFTIAVIGGLALLAYRHFR